jgi:hypothetical protein
MDPIMFNFSANNLPLLSRTECRSCVVFLPAARRYTRELPIRIFAEADVKCRAFLPSSNRILAGDAASTHHFLCLENLLPSRPGL